MGNAMLLISNIGVVLSELVLAPSNTVVVSGDELRMNCLTSNNSKVRNWGIFTTSLKPFTIYSPHKFNSLFKHFGVDVDDSGSGVLYTNSTKLSDAGMYKCLSVIDGVDKEHSAQLTVLESKPICEEGALLNGDNMQIWMQCSVTFRGFWAPTIEWIEYGGHLGPEGRIITKEAELIRIPNRIVTSNLTIGVNSSRNGSQFACKLYFAKYDGMYNMTASNVPNFTYTWNSSVVAFSFPVREYGTKTLDATELSTVTSVVLGDLGDQSSTDWYSISLSLVASLSVFFFIIIVLLVVFIIRFRNKLSAKYAAADSCKSEMAVHDAGYTTSDNYDTIDETVIDADLKVSFAPRKGPLPTPGYSGLMQTNDISPAAYARMDTYETPVDVTPKLRDMKVSAKVETIEKKQADDGDEKNDGNGEADWQQRRNQRAVHSYLDLVDNTDGCERTSGCDISSSYLTVNF